MTIFPLHGEEFYGKASVAFALKLASWQIVLCRGKKKRFAAESEVHCILGFGYS